MDIHGNIEIITNSVRLVTDEELNDPAFVFDVKNFGSKLRVPRRNFVDWFADGLRDADCNLIDASGNPVEVNFEEIEADGIDLWFRDWFKRPYKGQVVRVRAESRERVRLVATLLRMIFPKESRVWGN